MENSAVKWLYKASGRKKLYILALIIIQALNGSSGVLYALFLRNIVDSATEHDKGAFVTAALMIVGLVLVQITLKALIRWLNELSRAEIENIFKRRLLSQILKKDFSAVSAVHSGEWLNRLTNDTVVISQSYVEILPGLIGMIVKMISALVMITLLDYRFAFVFIPGGILMMFVTYGFRKVLKRLHKRIQEADGRLRVFLQERIGSLMMIRSFAAESSTRQQAEEKMTDHKKMRMRRNYFSNFSNIGFNFIMDGMYLFGVCYCGYGILVGRVTYGTLTAITQLISQIQAPFANITGYLPKYYAMIASAERLMEIEDFEDDIEQEPLDIEKINGIYKDELVSFGLRAADFAYYASCSSIGELTKENMPKVLDKISVELNKGQFVAFTGHSGCGKSTVLKLLMCIYRLDGGERYIKLSGGREEPLSALYHRLFAYVPQGNRLMSGTIRDVVCFAQPEDRNNDERINEALRIACADGFVGELEDGVDTLLGERGTGLSEGQMQRIAVARAIYSGSPILLLDEATSALDENTERQMLENLRQMTDKTVVIVTHRPAALSICDRVIEFDDNGVVG
ncbi:ABC transporter ATP-binding protein [Ruminococcus sp. NK3A76]|uniref:ABC transporter ATP-binding protein n=1 Tax=Ruminococcus sp. NK3A76 TaxID=877411 RepID=UPI00048FE43D|nr:ABC transporter ATP-binding protein [Ruminococcus sp. NK3A76]